MRPAQILSSALRKALETQPFTFRGLLVLVLSSLSLKYLAIEEDDLTAYMLGGAGIGIVGISAIGVFCIAYSLKRRLKIECFFDESKTISRSDVPAGITLSQSSIIPFFHLELTRVFEQSGTESLSHLVRGLEVGDKRYLIDTVGFPHRGFWDLSGIRCRLSDAFGLCACSWIKPQMLSVEISAPTLGIRPLPIVFGSSRAGDQFSASETRSGDLYDMKPYDPSDGVSRILWKTYARSGELIVRRPEPAIIPEGEVAIYLIANKSEDYVVGAFQSYLEQLVREQIVVLFGTDGMHAHEEPGEKQSEETQKHERLVSAETGFTSHPEQIRHAINRAVWNSSAGTGLGFDSYLESLSAAGNVIHQCIVFAPTHSQSDWLKLVERSANSQMIKLSLALVPEKVDPLAMSSQISEWVPDWIPRSRIFSQKRGGGFKIASSPNLETFICESTEFPLQY